MRYIKYGLRTFRQHIVSNLIIIVELAFLITALNVLIGSLNSRDVLYSPYEEIFKNGGYLYLHDYHMMTHDEETGEFKISEWELLNNTLSQLQGEVKAYYMLNEQYAGADGQNVRINYVCDDIFEKLSLPLDSGEWRMPENSKNYAVATSGSYLKTGTSIQPDINGQPLVISGVLTDVSYLPDMNKFESGKDVTMFYRSISRARLDEPQIIAPLSAVPEEFRSKCALSSVILIENKNVTPQQKAYNEKILEDSGVGSAYIYDIGAMAKKSQTYLKEDFNKSLPIVVCVWLISVIGLVCSTGILTARMLKNYSVYYICGAKWRDCLKISLVNSAVTSFVSLVLSIGIIKIGILDKFANDIGFVFRANNGIFTALLLLIMIGSSAIVPAIMLSFKQPGSVLRGSV